MGCVVSCSACSGSWNQMEQAVRDNRLSAKSLRGGKHAVFCTSCPSICSLQYGNMHAACSINSDTATIFAGSLFCFGFCVCMCLCMKSQLFLAKKDQSVLLSSAFCHCLLFAVFVCRISSLQFVMLKWGEKNIASCTILSGHFTNLLVKIYL